jgi:hypothetical protein
VSTKPGQLQPPDSSMVSAEGCVEGADTAAFRRKIPMLDRTW